MELVTSDDAGRTFARGTRMMKIAIEPGSVQETLIIPLYGRKLCAEMFPELYRDTSAARICANIDYDFIGLDRQAQNALWKFDALEAAMRQLDMQWEIHDYLARHPHSAIVNMGCGLDRTGQSCDNGTCRIYNVDMPNIIEARKLLSPAGERELNISSDLNNYSWMDKIDDDERALGSRREELVEVALPVGDGAVG